MTPAIVVAVEPQFAFAEALGADDISASEQIPAYARDAGLPVNAAAKRGDAKRGDIAPGARVSAEAFLGGARGRGSTECEGVSAVGRGLAEVRWAR